jgi:hypothetical protein
MLILGLCLAIADGPRAPAAATGADRVTLRDGSVVLGLVTSTTVGPRGSIEFLVRRDWAERHVKQHLEEWERATDAKARQAVEQRLQRLAAWRRDRSPSAGPDDRIVQWIDREQARLADPKNLGRSVLVSVRLPRSEVREVARQPAAQERLLRLAWLCELPEPESMAPDELKDAMEARGYAPDVARRSPSAALDRLLPLAAEPEATWLARRAATEVAVDADLQFLRYQDMVMPDVRGGQALDNLGLSTAVSQLTRLLEPDQTRPDPMAERLRSISARGRVGAVVTRLVIAPDLSGVTVESTLWVRAGSGGWAPFGSRTSTVRTEDLGPEAGRELAGDPQVQGTFRLVEGLGLGSVAAELKERSLRIGAATQNALGNARSDFSEYLNAMALPVLEPAPQEPGRKAAKPYPAAARDAPKSAPKAAGPRRSMLGPPDR